MNSQKELTSKPISSTNSLDASKVPNLTPDNQFLIGSAVGCGGQGIVFLGRHLSTGQLVAIKVCDSSRLAQTKREIEILSVLKHPTILSLIACSISVELSMTFLVFELCSGGELFNKIVQSPSGKFPEHVAQYYFRSLLNGVAFMHEKGCAHRDIKPENLLLTGLHELRISDFGLSRMSVPKKDASTTTTTPTTAPEIAEGTGTETEGSSSNVGSSKTGSSLEDMAQSFCGSLNYMAPEVCQCVWVPAPYSTKRADIWSAGMLLYVMLVGGIPWKRAIPADLGYLCLINGNFKYPTTMSQNAIDVIKACLQPNPMNRKTANEILKMKWLNDTASITIPTKEMNVLARSVSGDPKDWPSNQEYVDCGWLRNGETAQGPAATAPQVMKTTSASNVTPATSTNATSTESTSTSSSSSSSERPSKRQRVDSGGTVAQSGNTTKTTTEDRPELHVGRAIAALGWHAVKHDKTSVRDAVKTALASLNLYALVQDNDDNSQVEILVLKSPYTGTASGASAGGASSTSASNNNNGSTTVKENATLTQSERLQVMKAGQLVCIVRVINVPGGTPSLHSNATKEETTTPGTSDDGEHNTTIHISRPQGDVFEFHNLYKKLRVLLGGMNSGAR